MTSDPFYDERHYIDGYSRHGESQRPGFPQASLALKTDLRSIGISCLSAESQAVDEFH
jgi:hypothetical protein